MNDLISVIIPFYKSPLTKLRLCIESFIRQSYKNFELLIIDDGNPENIDYLKEEYEKRDARIRFIRQKNGGVSAARNHGIDIARGEYMVFCDSDDYVESILRWICVFFPRFLLGSIGYNTLISVSIRFIVPTY